jgi:hypothetical protein
MYAGIYEDCLCTGDDYYGKYLSNKHFYEG